MHGTQQPPPDFMEAKIPPNAMEAEKALLGSILISPKLLDEVSHLLSSRDFYNSRGQTLYGLFLELHNQGTPIDTVSVAQEADRLGLLDEIGGPVVLVELMGSSPNTRNVVYYAKEIREASRKRAALEMFRGGLKRLHEPQADVDEVLGEVVDFTNQLDSDADWPYHIDSIELNRSTDDLEYLIDGMLVAGQPCILAGGKKCLKTNLMIDMALSISSGTSFLGRFPVKQWVRVGLMSGESGPATIKETAKRIAMNKYRDLESFTDIRWSFDLPKFGEAKQERQLQRFIERNDLRVLMIDPAYLCLPIGNDAGNLFVVGETLKQIGEIGQRTECTIILAHHTTKSSGREFAMPELADIAWSGFQEFARQWFLIGRRKKYDPEQGGHHELWLNVGGSAGHSCGWALNIDEGTRDDAGGRRWDVEILSPSEAVRDQVNEQQEQKQKATEIELENRIDKVLELFQEHPDGLTTSKAKAKLAWNHHKVKSCIDILIERGELEQVPISTEVVTKIEDGKSKKSVRTYPGYRVPILNGTNGSELVQTNEDHLGPPLVPTPPIGGGTDCGGGLPFNDAVSGKDFETNGTGTLSGEKKEAGPYE
ncbi:MAG: AAA family ATPase [Planctomycetaceae bacterium]|nr:AAA family ATPase [Planctomycetaceae bacterium]